MEGGQGRKVAICNKGVVWERPFPGPESAIRYVFSSLHQHFWRFCINIFDDSVSTFLTILHQHFWRFWLCREVGGRSWLRGESNSSQEIADKLQQIIEDNISKLTLVSTLKQHSGENECVDATIGILEYTKNMKELPKEYTTLLKEIRKDSPISSWLPSFSQKDTRHKFNFRVSLFSPGMLGAANFSAGRGDSKITQLATRVIILKSFPSWDTYLGNKPSRSTDH